MPPKKRRPKETAPTAIKGVIDGAGEVVQQKIATTIEEN